MTLRALGRLQQVVSKFEACFILLKSKFEDREAGANMSARPKEGSMTDTEARPARYIMVGGFLGAGKSTAIGKLARYLEDSGERVGLVTNDQSEDLVDTALGRAEGYPVEEIADGCFCCRFDDLIEASRRLARDARPTVYIAEPVGCCTDLVATVSRPLLQLHGDDYVISPLSVMVDPVRAGRVLGLQRGGGFSPDVIYIYEKQLEEADVIVINKSDILGPGALNELDRALSERFPRASRFTISARRGDGLSRWFDHVLRSAVPRGEAMELDYDRYARGEASLAWLNCAVRADSEDPIDSNGLLLELAQKLHHALVERHHEVAHLKMTFTPDDSPSELAMLNLVRNDLGPELARRMERPARRGQVILNLRVEAAPESIRPLVELALRESRRGLTLRVERLVCFQPARPRPRHRLVRLDAG
jgi:G3E family GTPase